MVCCGKMVVLWSIGCHQEAWPSLARVMVSFQRGQPRRQLCIYINDKTINGKTLSRRRVGLIGLGWLRKMHQEQSRPQVLWRSRQQETKIVSELGNQGSQGHNGNFVETRGAARATAGNTRTGIGKGILTSRKQTLEATQPRQYMQRFRTHTPGQRLAC